jgi:hypothetical protein
VLAVQAIPILLAAGVALVAGGEQASSKAASETTGAILEAGAAYCQIREIDNEHERLTKDRWRLAAGPHKIFLECNASFKPAEWQPVRTELWHFNRTIEMEVRTGARYALHEYILSEGQEFVWIEDAQTGEVAGGNRPGRMNPPELEPADAIRANLASFGSGSTLVIQYEAPKKKIYHLRILLDDRIVVDTYGNEDLTLKISAAPGEHDVVTRVQNRVDYLNGENTTLFKLPEGRKRTILIKASYWGKAAIRMK